MSKRVFISCVILALLATSAIAAGPDFAALKIQPYDPRRPAPDFTLQNLEGKTIRLADYRGKLLLLFFYTTW